MFPNVECRVAYRVLNEWKEKKGYGPTLNELRREMARYMGKESAQADRRMRELRRAFVVKAVRSEGVVRYDLAGWRPDAESRSTRKSISPRSRALLFSRGARCMHCGRTPQDDEIRLVVDHKIPLDLNGTNDDDNLQLLCVECNHAKQALFAEFSELAPAIRAAITLDEPQLRIGELLKASVGAPVPTDLITVVAREENRGDPARRLRELRSLGWRIMASRHKVGRRTVSYYTLEHAEPWPEEGPRAVINRLEAQRRRTRRSTR